MRPILITPAIMSLAEGYAKNMDKGQDLAKKPLDNLMQLKMDVANPKTIIRFSKKHQNQGGQPKSIFKGNERTEFSKYIEYIIEHYNSINSKHPKDYDELAEEMEKIVPQEDLSTIIQIGKKKTFVSFANRIVIAMDYEGVRDKVFRKFINDPQLNIKTCVYCNAQFAITTLLSPAITEEDIRKIKGRGRKPDVKIAKYGATYELDHNKPKSKFPYLCTNFFNLQPVCSSCNRHKSYTSDLDYSMYYWDGINPKPLYFELNPENLIKFQLSNKCDGMVPILRENGNKGLVEKFNKYFSIEKIYSCHADFVEELLWRYKIYSKSGRDALIVQYSSLFEDDIDVERFILGTYSKSEDVHKRPLTAMMQDLFEQLRKEEGNI